MIYVSAKERKSIDIYRKVIYNYIKENSLKYSDQRERVLKILYTQHYPVSVDFLVKKLSDEKFGASYATVSRHMKFFEKLDMLIVVKKAQKGYLLSADIDDSDIEVKSSGIN